MAYKVSTIAIGGLEFSDGEVNQKEKDRYYMVTLTCGI